MSKKSDWIKKDFVKQIIHLKSVRFAIIGFVAAIIFTFMMGREQSLPKSIVQEPNPIPFKESICGNGIIEANTKNIELGAFQPGIVMQILVKEGDEVKKGDVLLKLDDRAALCDVDTNAVKLAETKAAYEIAVTDYQEALEQFERAKKLKKDVISSEERKRREFAHDRLKAQMEVSRQKIQQAQQSLNMSKLTLEQTKILAPVDGTILKVYPTVGSHVSNQDQIMIMGNINPLYVRVKIDETDISYFNPKSKAVAIQRSITASPIDLTFVKIDPIALSKTNLQGTSRELVDTRVIDVIYAMPKNIAVYVGQRIDVYIQK